MELEYKTISAQTPLFASTSKMHEVLAEEAKAGWSLYEKQDNYRIKLVRNISQRNNDKNIDIDAYRSTVGVSPIITYSVTAIVTIGLVSLILYFALWTNT